MTERVAAAARRSAGAITRVDRTGLRPGEGVRLAAVVVVPLAIAVAARHVMTGIELSVGALTVGLADPSGERTHAVRTMAKHSADRA